MRSVIVRLWHALRRGWRRLVGDSWRLALARVVAVLAAMAIGGFAFVSAGLMPIAASESHWAVTRVFLHYVMRRSVATQTIGLSAPPLDDPALITKGAGHYATGCLPCHGAPGVPRSPVVERMLPVPPSLHDLRGGLTAEETFWVIRHGLKYTAMPGWLAQEREDEVWAMVAFVRRLPALDADGFRALAHGEEAGRMRAIGGAADLAPLSAGPSASTPVLANCSRCHGRDGAGRGDGAFPRLAGQPEAYLRATLQAYARGERHSGIMQPALAGLEAREIDALARHYASQSGRPKRTAPAADAGDAAAIARGRRLAHDGDGARRIPVCAACHGPGATPANPMHPRLAGQHADYLALQLRLLRAGTRGGTALAPVMEAAAASLSDRDIEDLAAYYASLP